MSPPSNLTTLPTLSHILAARATERTDQLAFADASSSLTYGQLDREASRLAGAFQSSGIQRGDRVALFLSSGVVFARIFWGLQRLGAVPCAFNPNAPAAICARRAARIRPSLIVLDHAAPPELSTMALAARRVTVDELDAAPPTTTSGEGGADDVAYLQPTSGTSGEPRYAVLLQRNVIAFMRSLVEALPPMEDDVYVGWVPPWHDLGLVRFVIGGPVNGAPCHFVTPAIHTLPLFLKTIERVRGTVTGAPDFAWRLAARLTEAGVDLSSLRYAGNGGEPVRMSTIREFDAKFGLRGGVLRPGYGLAEATLAVAVLRDGEEPHADENGNVSCGRPVPGVEIRIASSDGREGEILVRGQSVFAGYFDAEEATAEALRDGWLHTGDTGRIDDPGELYVLGRTRAMLKRGGAVIAPRELEEAAQGVPGVRIAAAISIPDDAEESTERIVVAVEVDPDADPGSIATAVTRAEHAALGFAPDGVLVLAPRSIARTWNGKIRHGTLRTELIEGALSERGVILFRLGRTT